MPDFNELQNQMLRSAKFDEPLIRAISLCGLGIGGEAGEISDLVKKIVFHGHPFNPVKFIEEGGDLLWYVAYLCHVLSLDFEAVMTGIRPTDKVLYLEDARLFTRAALKLTDLAGSIAYGVDWLVYTHPEELHALDGYKQALQRKLTLLVAWLREIAICVFTSLEEMCQANIEKLLKRYPDGFSFEASLARVDAR